MSSQARSGSAADTLRIYFSASLLYKRSFALMFLHPVGAVLLGVAVPFFAGKVLAGLTNAHADLQPQLIWLGVVSAAGVIANRVGFMQLMTLQAQVMSALHQRVFSHLLHRSVGFHADRISGKLISDVIDFTNSYGQLLTAVIISTLSFLATVLIGLIVVFINSWQLGFFLLFLVVGILGWSWFDSRRRSALRSRRLVATKELTAHLSDSIVNAQTIKTFAREQLEQHTNKQLNKTLESLRVHDWQLAGRTGSNRSGALLAMQFCMFLLIVYLHGAIRRSSPPAFLRSRTP